MELKWIDNRYQIIRPLGTGGTSKVYLAIDRGDPDEPEVAIKLLGQLPAANREDLEVFFSREVHALQMLNHPTIVRLLDHGNDADKDILYLVLEYVEGADTLSDRVLKWKPDTVACLNFIVDLLQSVAYAHESKVIHRDLNPGNILMDRAGDPKIIDFGIAKIMGTLSAGHTVRAYFTPSYASPEQVAQRSVDCSSDVYSLAAVLYFVLTCTHPNADLPLADQIDSLEQVPAQVRAVARGMAAASASDRYNTASQATRALQAARRVVQKQTERYYVVLTNNAIGGLYKQAVTESQDPVEARKVVSADLASAVHIVSGASATALDYDLIGSAMSLRCTLVANEHFAVRSIASNIPPHALEGLRQRGFPVDVEWEVGIPGTPKPAGVVPLSSLLDESDAFQQQREIERKTRQRRKDLVETWRNLLDLEREMKVEMLRQVDYTSYEVTDDNWMINAELATDINLDEVFAQNQLLTMPSTSRKRMAVGYYHRQAGRHMLISKLSDVNTALIAPTGKIIVDERQWTANWTRQSRALDTVVDARCVNARLSDILIDPQQAKQLPEQHVATFFNSDLDDAKKQAVRCALATRDVYLVQGPPGTGKTVLISEIVAQVLASAPKSRILLVSQSNVAIDHVLAKVGDLRPDVRMVRIGRPDAIGLGAEKYLVDRRLADWIESVRAKSLDYLISHRSPSIERENLEHCLEILAELRPRVRQSATADVSLADPGGDVNAGLMLIREAFPDLEIEPAEQSIGAAAKELSQRIEATKSNLETTLETWRKRLGTLEEFQEAYLQACSVVAGTCVGIVGERNLPDRFDWVIVDEAGRATPSEILISLVRGDRAVLVGDHKQLPPVIDHDLLVRARKDPDIDQVWLEQSLFEYLFRTLPPVCKMVLTNQYRMHPHIAHLIASVFYPQEPLVTKVSPEDRAHGWSRWPTAVVWYSTGTRRDRFEEPGPDGSKCNACEINIIETQLASLEKDLRDRKLQKTVAVITGYSAQQEQMQRQIDPQDDKRWRAMRLAINTVDAFQGRDQDIVFYSVVRSNSSGRIGFLQDARRLNVALSRARELLFIVGDHHMVARAHTHDGLNPFTDVITHIVGNPRECTMYIEEGTK